MWTRFMDMASGGTQKEDFAYAYIEAPEEEAKIVFYNRFGHNPARVTCTWFRPGTSVKNRLLCLSKAIDLCEK